MERGGTAPALEGVWGRNPGVQRLTSRSAVRQMPMRHTQRLSQKPTVSPQLVLANELLQFSSLELEQAIAHELAENPALELSEARCCPRCGSEMPDGFCSWCGAVDDHGEQIWDVPHHPDRAWDYGPSERGAGADWQDPISRLSSRTTLSDHVLHQARLSLPAEGAAVAAHLVESLDDRGFLRCDLDEVASAAGVDRGCVEQVLSVVQSLDPVGIAARNARECLLVQIEYLREEGVEQPLVKQLIEEHWQLLGRCSPGTVAEEIGVTVDEVCEALDFIKHNLNPYPAHACWVDLRDSPPEDSVVCPQPDVIIRGGADVEGQYEIELPKARGRTLRVSSAYRRALDQLGAGGQLTDQRGWEQWKEFQSRARLFVRSIEQRWRTLYELTSCLIDCQRDFLAHGEIQLKPLTRARVAEMMNVHESTVSRAVAGKYAQLPCGEVVPLEKFFDSAAPVKRMIQELVDQESEPLTDGKIAEKLAERGYDLARRTVAKYRNALGILPYSLRRHRKGLSR